MNKKTLSKILAIMLVITLTFANFIFLAVYAASVNYEAQETNINKTDVSFDAYFISEEGQKTHKKETEMNNSELKLFLGVTITKGYLKDAQVKINNSNFKIVKGQELPEGVQAIDEENGTITLNQISKGEAKEIPIQIEVVKDEKFDLNNFSKDAEIKLTGTFVNNSAQERKAEKSIIVNLSLSEKAESALTGKISKYVNFEENGNKKALLQLMVSSKVINNLLPVKSTEINLNIPTLFGIEPEKVSVTSSSTKATNGDDGTAFNDTNYEYSEGKIKINVSNIPNETNQVSWAKDSTDQYLINLVYIIDNIENEPNEEMKKVQLSIESKLELYNNGEKEVIKQVSGELKLPEPSKSVVSYEINNEINEIAKGYMLVKDAANTEYKQNIKVNIGYNPTVNNIEINKNQEYYTEEAGNTYTATTYYKEISINRENLIKILGENGKIELISDGVILATLSKDITSYTLEEEISNISIITSKPIIDGILTIQAQKYIKSAEYDESITSRINKLITHITGKTGNIEETVNAEITLTQPTLQISSSIKSSNLSTIIENENVEIRVVLQTNNNTNRLFKDPIIEIELPSYVEDIKINSINPLLYNKELEVKTGNITTNSEGNKVITIQLQGTQTKFNDILSVEGTTLIIGANITVGKTAPSITQKMKVRVLDDKKEIVETSSNITYMAPTGIITLNTISGYNDEQIALTSMSGEEETGKIEIGAKSRIATETISVINNYDYTCGNILILGRTPHEGNKSLTTKDDLGSTFTAKMVSGIRAIEGISNNDIAVYYSENPNATKDLSNSSNGWTLTPSNLGNVKSYLIVVQEQIEKGDKIVFNYDIEIPEGLSREESTYGMYQVSYTNLDGALKGVNETVESPKIGLSTGLGPELKVELTSNVQANTQVREGEIIEYKVKITNTGKSIANNVELEVPIPNGSYYTTQEYAVDLEENIYKQNPQIKTYTETISSIQVGETVEKAFLLTVGDRIEINMEDYIKRANYSSEEAYQKAIDDLGLRPIAQMHSIDVKVTATAKTYYENELQTFTSNTIVNPKTLGYFKLKLDLDTIDGVQLKQGTKVQYKLSIEKLGINTYNNLAITCNIPNGLKYNSSELDEGITEEINGSTITWKKEKLKSKATIKLNCEITEINQEKTISLDMAGTCNEYNGTIKSNTRSFTVGKPKLEILHSSNNTTGNLTENDEITYTIAIKNTSNVTAYNVKITDYASEGLHFKTLKYTLGNQTDIIEISGKTHNYKTSIPANSTLILEITATALELEENEQNKKVSNRFEVTGDDIDKMSSTTIEHTVNKTVYTTDDNQQTVTKYSISGQAWLDKNSNGIKDIDEEILPQIPVILIDEAGKTIASDITNENGAYIFNNIIKGNYIVVFLYDMGNYDVTTYGVGDSTKNSDAVTMKVNIDGIETQCAATNVINLTSNIYNIDLGLVVSPKFDLSLTKAISKVTVKTSKGTTTNNYNNSKLEKIEIATKQLEGAVVTVEYAITVTNTGAIPGYATRIVDYLSSTDLKFNSEVNPDWYLGTDGNLYNSSIAKTQLQPGESVSLKLILTKQVTEGNTGLTNNTAEIYEAYNDAGIEDYNSTPGNKAQNENDLGQADIIIVPKTGVVLYIGIVIIVMSIMTAGIYILNKKVISKM